MAAVVLYLVTRVQICCHDFVAVENNVRGDASSSLNVQRTYALRA
jgi:hypothetical protein